MKKIITAAILGFTFLFIGLSSTNAVTLTVTKTFDSNDNVCNSDCSLREAIFAAAATGDTIEFASPLFDSEQTIVLFNGELFVTKTLTINGKGANLTKISGNNTNRVFSNVSGNLTLKNLTVTRGRVGGNNNIGAGIFNDTGRTLIINDCIIFDNTVQTSGNARGGGIYNGGYTEIVRSTVSTNFVIGHGFKEGGGIANFGTLVIHDSTFSGNSASGAIGNYGGAINNYGGAILTNTTISGNTVGGSNENLGGGINSSGNLTVINVTITLNTTGIYKGGGTVNAINTIISGNGINLSGNSGLNLSSANYIGDNARLGLLANNGGTTQTHALLSGSPALNVGNNCVLTADGCGIGNPALTNDQRGSGFPRLQNTAVDIGAVESARGVVLNANSSGAGSLFQTIADATAGDTITFDPSFFALPRTIPVTGGNLVINKNLTIIGTGVNSLTFDGGNASRVLYVGANVTLSLSDLRITRGFSPSDVSAGGILIDGGTLIATRIAVDNCTAGPLGGGIYNFGALILSDSSVSNNSANNAAGIYNETGKTAEIRNSSVTGNTATGNAGGIGNGGTLNFYNSTLSGNIALLAGGLGNGGSANFVNSTVSGNRATNDKGGGIYNNNGAGSILQLLNTTITNNRADMTAGAGIWNENFGSSPITVRVRNTIIAGNISNASSSVDYVGSISDLGNNLININNPGLAPLGNYGGATPTHALLSNSAALNAGSDCVLTANNCGFTHSTYANDQRGTNAPRKIGASVDIGAFEQSVTFNQTILPNGNVNANYNQQLSANRQTSFNEFQNLAPTAFEIIPVAGQSLPPGMTLSPSGLLSGIPTITGIYSFTVKATDTDGIAGAQSYTMQILAPTAANALISGRVLATDGNGIRNAIVTLTDANGTTRTARSTAFGYFLFDEIESGQTVTISVISKRFQFTPQILTINEDITELNLIANE